MVPQNEGGEEEEEEQYILNGQVVRKIQIEDDDGEYFMDEQGQIFNGEGQFIGTANTNDVEGDDSQQM